MPKKDFTARAEQDLYALASTYDETQPRKGIRAGTRGLTGARMIAIERLRVDPNQPRKTHSEDGIRGLAASIKEYGVLQPITVVYREDEDLFQIITGERRYKAARLAGLKEIPCIIKEAQEDEKLLQQLMENLQREDLPPLEEAEGLRALIDHFGYSQGDIARILGRSKSSISETLSLIKLPEEIKTEVRTSELFSKNVLLQIVREGNSRKKWDLWKKVKNEDLTVREARKAAKKAKSERGPKPFSYRYRPEDRSYTLHITFKKSRVPREELIRILREIASRMEQSQDSDDAS